MRSSVLLIAFVLLAAPALSGCIGVGGDDGEDLNETGDTNDTSPEGNESEEEPPSDENETGEEPPSNETDENRTEEETDDGTQWTYDNRTGTVQGTNAIVTSSGSSEETFSVDPNTVQLALNLSADGGELEMCIRTPGGGNESGNSSEEECTESTTTEGGNATFSMEAPPEGEWSAELRPADPGPHTIDYELVIAQLVSTEDDGGFGY